MNFSFLMKTFGERKSQYSGCPVRTPSFFPRQGKIELSCLSDSLRVNLVPGKTSFGGIAYALLVNINRLKYKANYPSEEMQFLK